jgi:hypothetical protein|tara:strand:- start:1850 stop:2182 length:333 start_codon:yes stop_codon:yes gene_type:complete
MTTTTITVPDVESILEVKNEAGEVLLEAEVIYLDHLVSLAQKDIEAEDDKAVLIWLPKFCALVHEMFDCELSGQDAFFVARQSTKLMWEVKKKYASMLTLQEPTESTPST